MARSCTEAHNKVLSAPKLCVLYCCGTACSMLQVAGSHRLPVRTCIRLEYKEIAPLGSGNFSRVYKVKCRFDGMVYAAKRTARALRSDADKKRWQQVMLQAQASCRFSHALVLMSSQHDSHSRCQ